MVPPSIGTNGQPRTWSDCTDIRPLPELFFTDLAEHLKPAEAKRSPVTDLNRTRSVQAWDAEQRATAYLKKCEPAISGQRGHDKLFKAACKIGPGFDLPLATTFRLIETVYNPTCNPPWSEKELRHKIEDAYETATERGFLLNARKTETNGHTNGTTEPASAAVAEEPAEYPDDPFRLARSFLARRSHAGFPTLRYWLEEWHRWDGQCYRIVAGTEIRAELVQHVKAELDQVATEVGKPPARVTTGLIGNVMQALTGLSLLSQSACANQPVWLDDSEDESPLPVEMIPARNGLIHLPALIEGRRGLIPSTPRFFSPNVLGYDFDPQAPRPEQWLSFLASIWPDDPQSIQCLQEWLGYLLTPDTSQQKILVLIGPTRSGKGTIARVISSLVGERNACSPTLSGMASNFGIAPLIGKTVAIFPDARLSGRTDSQVIVERLLSISGEDSQTIDRKHLSSWTGRLTTRFVLISNELPRLGDSSGAITARTVILRMVESFLGREDTDLHRKLMGELPAILWWAIVGWARLRKRGRFLQPESGLELLEDMKELSSPIGSFLEERCNLGPDLSVKCAVLYEAWKTWCNDHGRDHPGDESGFGRSLHSALPKLRKKRKGSDGERVREYIGIELKVAY